MNDKPQRPTEYRTKLRRHNLLRVLSVTDTGITDAERDELVVLAAELDEMDMDAAKAQVGAI